MENKENESVVDMRKIVEEMKESFFKENGNYQRKFISIEK